MKKKKPNFRSSSSLQVTAAAAAFQTQFLQLFKPSFFLFLTAVASFTSSSKLFLPYF